MNGKVKREDQPFRNGWRWMEGWRFRAERSIWRELRTAWLFACISLLLVVFEQRACAVGTVVGWGFNAQGQASPPYGLDDAVEISAGWYHSMALRKNGTVVCWGDNTYGQSTPPAGVSFVAIACGAYNCLGLKSDGTLMGWGWNQYGQSSQPPGFTNVVALAAGAFHSVALRSDGTVLAWGYNDYGQSSPPPGLSGVVAIAVGDKHCLALKNDGTVVAWGYNGNGQSQVPAGLNQVVAISASSYHSMALKSDGTVVSWGGAPFADVTPPAGLNDAVAIAAGMDFAMAIRSDGTVLTWGNPPYSPSLPMPPNLSMVVRIAAAAGGAHRLALVGDLTPPEITVIGSNPITVYQGSTYLDAGATALDDVDGPLPVNVNNTVNSLISGTYTVTYSATDSHQNSASEVRTVYVVPPPVPVTSVLYLQGEPVPAAGVSGSGIPSGATWNGFGVPAINDAQTVAFQGRWRSPSGSGSGIFVGGTLVLKAGGAVPGITGATWRGFSDPVLAQDGRVVTLGFLSGSTVRSSTDAVIVTVPFFGVPSIVARSGDVAPGANGARFAGFERFSVSGPSVAFAANLVLGSGLPTTTLSSDSGIWVTDPSTPLSLALRKGQQVQLSAGTPARLQSFTFLPLTWGSSGMGRGHHFWDGFNSYLRFGARLADGRSAQMQVLAGEAPESFSETGAGVGMPDLSGATFKQYGHLACSDDGALQTFFASLAIGNGGVTPSNAQGIFLSNPDSGLFEVVARQGSEADGTSGTYATLSDPVFSPDGSALAWLGSVKGGALSGGAVSGVWWKPNGELPEIVAREGALVSGIPGAKWRIFDSIALPGYGRGPLLIARMQSGPARLPGPGGVTVSTERGLWAVDSSWSLQLLFREGVTQVGGKTLRSFTTMQYVEGVPGVTRSFNTDATIVWRAVFTDGSSGLLKTTVP